MVILRGNTPVERTCGHQLSAALDDSGGGGGGDSSLKPAPEIAPHKNRRRVYFT